MSLEVKLIALLVFLAALAGGGVYLHHLIYEAGDTAGATRIQSLWDADTRARDLELQAAQAKNIADQKAHDAIVAQAQVDHEKLVVDNQAATAALLDRVRDLEATLRLGPVPGAVEDSTQSGGAAPVPGSDAELADTIRRFNEAVKSTAEAGFHDSAELAGIYAIAPK